MRTQPVVWLLLCLLGAVPGPAQRQDHGGIRVMSFNIRYGLADDGANSWAHRRELVFQILRSKSFDFIGLQEALPFQVAEVLDQLPGYLALVRTREEDPTRGESCAILYRADRWAVDRTRSGTFWLSETPEVAASKSWDSALPRIVTWGAFSDESGGLALYVYNTHFDHRGERARLESAKLLREHTATRELDLPIVVLGDLNAGESTPPIEWLTARRPGIAALRDSWRVLHPDAPNAGTFNGWQGRTDGAKIDYVLVGPGIEVLDAEIVRTTFAGRHPSDHDPVTATLRLRRSRASQGAGGGGAGVRFGPSDSRAVGRVGRLVDDVDRPDAVTHPDADREISDRSRVLAYEIEDFLAGAELGRRTAAPREDQGPPVGLDGGNRALVNLGAEAVPGRALRIEVHRLHAEAVLPTGDLLQKQPRDLGSAEGARGIGLVDDDLKGLAGGDGETPRGK